MSFDWVGLLRIAVQRLGLAPEAFWELTPAELQMLFGPVGGQKPMSRDGLDALMAAYPDVSKGEVDGSG